MRKEDFHKLSFKTHAKGAACNSKQKYSENPFLTNFKVLFLSKTQQKGRKSIFFRKNFFV